MTEEPQMTPNTVKGRGVMLMCTRVAFTLAPLAAAASRARVIESAATALVLAAGFPKQDLAALILAISVTPQETEAVISR